DYLQKFTSKFIVATGIGVGGAFEKDADGSSMISHIEFPVDHMNAVASGKLEGINSSANFFAGLFHGELVRKKDTMGCYLIPVVWAGRLLIFFPQVKKTTNAANTAQQGSFSKPSDHFEVKMSWSEYRNGKWTQKQTSTDILRTNNRGGLTQVEYFKFVPVIQPNLVSILFDERLDRDGGYTGEFVFDGNSIFIGPGRTTEAMTMNLFNKIETTAGAVNKSQTLSWQVVGANRNAKSLWFEDVAKRETIHGLAPASNFFHPYTHDMLSAINSRGLPDLFAYNLAIADKAEAFGGAGAGMYNELNRPFSIYNWELFFHVPMMIAGALKDAGQHKEAMDWHNYVLDPGAKGTDAKRAWRFQPFKEISTDNVLDKFFLSLQPNTADEGISQWRNNPFQPHQLSRQRPSAYMKWVVMEYLDNLIAWGDKLFRQDTIETVNLATQFYIMASHMVSKAETIPKQGRIKAETYNSLLKRWDAFGNAMVELELIAPFSQQTTETLNAIGNTGNLATANIFGFASSLYFCIPNNPKITEYRNTINDRLYKIRHCENIEGVFRMMPLWDPPIDPALLVAAAAQGLSLDTVLNDLNSTLPNYRFPYLLQKAIDVAGEVKAMGNMLTSVIEKKEMEKLSAMRAVHETRMQTLVMEVKKLQVDEAASALEGLQQNRITASYRLRHYLELLGEDLSKIPADGEGYSEIANPQGMMFVESGLRLIADEKQEMDKASDAQIWQLASSGVEALSGVLSALPDQLAFDLVGFIKEGGTHIGPAASAAAKVLQIVSSIYSFESAQAQRKAGFRRQLQDRILQANLAGYECMQIDKQILTQKIRINLANQEITNQQQQIDNSLEVEDYLKSKYTNEELYKWMEGQVKTIHRQLYNLAYDWANKAQKVFAFDRGLSNFKILQNGYFDAAHDGLLAGEKLFLGLKQLEAAYNETRGHDFEVVKHISMQQLDPIALLNVRETGKCSFAIPETLFDLDFPGQYMRRIKSVAVSIPCIAGPYSSVNATLRLQEHSYRVSYIATGAIDYPRKKDEEDDRFMTARIPISAIATSSAQRDSGVFELNFKDERYMPFEGAGVISKWTLELPEIAQFNYETISDIVVHISYTSKDGGDKLKKPAHDSLLSFLKDSEDKSQREGLFALFDIKNDF
ncbi:MAG: neuraminidase-like domain-containing protein, partial [Flavitalea sp.]